jgi:hypothetical protein
VGDKGRGRGVGIDLIGACTETANQPQQKNQQSRGKSPRLPLP